MCRGATSTWRLVVDRQFFIDADGNPQSPYDPYTGHEGAYDNMNHVCWHFLEWGHLDDAVVNITTYDSYRLTYRKNPRDEVCSDQTRKDESERRLFFTLNEVGYGHTLVWYAQMQHLHSLDEFGGSKLVKEMNMDLDAIVRFSYGNADLLLDLTKMDGAEKEVIAYANDIKAQYTAQQDTRVAIYQAERNGHINKRKGAERAGRIIGQIHKLKKAIAALA